MKDLRIHNEIKKYSGILTRQQIKTLHGQVKAGDKEGAYKGLVKILKRVGGVSGQ